MPRKAASESSVAACALPAAPGCEADACSASSEVYSRSRRPCSTLGGTGPSQPLPPGWLGVAAEGVAEGASAAPASLTSLSLLLLLSLSLSLLLLLPLLLLSPLLPLLPSSLPSSEESSSEESSDEDEDASEPEVEEDRPPGERTCP